MSAIACRVTPLALLLALSGCGEDPQQVAARQRAEQAAAEVRAEISAAREQAQREMQASQEARPAAGDVTLSSEPESSNAAADPDGTEGQQGPMNADDGEGSDQSPAATATAEDSPPTDSD